MVAVYDFVRVMCVPLLKEPLCQAISEPIRRLDGAEKIAGLARYCADIRLDGLLFAKTLRSDRPRALIVGIDRPPLPDGYWIVDHRDIPGRNTLPAAIEDQPFLAADRVNYIGEPILLVIGPDKQVILDILAQIKVHYQDLRPILSIDDALACTDDFIYANSPCFVDYAFGKGDLEAAAKRASQQVTDEITTGHQEQAYIETQGVIGACEGQRIAVFGSLQCPYYLKSALVQAFGWAEDRVRVVQLPTGGAFGGKEEFPSLPGVHAALAAYKTGHPVQVVYDREEDIICTTKRHPGQIRLTSYLDSQGRIIGRDIDIQLDGGAYAGLSGVVLQRSLFAVCGVYDVPHLRLRGRVFATNQVVSGAFRGFGGPQAFFAIEMHMESIARRLNMDSLVLKQRHFFRQGDSSSTGGIFRSPIVLDKIIERLEAISDYRRKHARYAAESSGSAGQPRRGIGCSVFFHGCGFTGAGERDFLHPTVRLEKYADDTVEIFVSSTEMGQGSLTTLRKVVARALDIPVSRVRHTYPDTDTAPDSGPTVASRTAMIVGRLLQDCAEKARQRWAEPAFLIEQTFTYPAKLEWDKDRLLGDAYLEYAWGANVVEVTIDPLSFAPTVTGIWAVFDCGTPLDSQIVQGQVEGGIVQGLGYGSLEVMRTVGGRLQQTSLTNYIIPTSRDFPPVIYELVDNPYENGPSGARGIGELTLIGAAPALALAVRQAVGQPVCQLPVTPEYVMELSEHGHDSAI